MTAADRIVASWMLNRDAIPEVGDPVDYSIGDKTKAFWVGKALVSLKARNEPTDYISVRDCLEAWQVLDDIGDDYLLMLVHEGAPHLLPQTWRGERGSVATVVAG